MKFWMVASDSISNQPSKGVEGVENHGFTYVFKINGLFWFWKKVGLGLHNKLEGNIYTLYISDIYSELGDYMLPTTFYKNLKNLLTPRQWAPGFRNFSS